MFYIHNHSSSSAYKGLPWEKLTKTPPESALLDKVQFAKWSAAPTTEHMFFSVVEGESDTLRVDAKDNIPYKIHGAVADYDAEVSPETLKHALDTAPTEFLPNYISMTFSGNARAVWLFESPVLVSSWAAAVAFQKEAARQLKLSKFLAGFDEKAF
jgi:hypothetical protein